jgi:hypothetical protein
MLLGTLLSATIAALSGVAIAAPGNYGGGGGSWNNTHPCKPGSGRGGYKDKCNQHPMKKPDCNKQQAYCAIDAKTYSKYGT